MKKVLSHLTEFKKECVLAPLFKMLEATFELLVPLVMASVIDTGIRTADKGYIIRMCVILVGLGVIGLASSVTAQFFAAKAAIGFSTSLRHALFSHIQSLSFAELDTIGNSTLITRMTSDVNQAQNGVNMFLRLFLRSPFIVIGAMVMAFTIDAKAALIFAITIPILSLVVFIIMKFTIPMYKKVQSKLDRVLLNTRENLTGTRVIRAFHKEEDEISQFHADHGELTGMQLFVGRISALMNPLTYIIINLAIIALLYVGAFRVNQGIITQGQLVALVNYMSQILVELIKLANLIVTLTKATASIGRVESLLLIQSTMEFAAVTQNTAGENRERKTEKNTGENKRVPSVSFEHVSLTYKDAGAEALSDIDFKVYKGETIGIIGGTGAGKTSLVHLIPRYYDVTKGSVLLSGKNVKEYSQAEIHKKVGVVMQNAVLFKGTIRENLLWGSENATDKQIWEALSISQAKEFVDLKSDKLDTQIEQGGKNLSGGQRQRLSITRTLMQKPEVLILDDSSSALDYATDAKLRKAIREMKEAPTVFVVTQRTSSVMHADKIIVLDDGEIKGIGTHESLLESCDIYKEIYDSQFEKGEEHSA